MKNLDKIPSLTIKMSTFQTKTQGNNIEQNQPSNVTRLVWKLFYQHSTQIKYKPQTLPGLLTL